MSLPWHPKINLFGHTRNRTPPPPVIETVDSFEHLNVSENFRKLVGTKMIHYDDIAFFSSSRQSILNFRNIPYTYSQTGCSSWGRDEIEMILQVDPKETHQDTLVLHSKDRKYKILLYTDTKITNVAKCKDIKYVAQVYKRDYDYPTKFYLQKEIPFRASDINQSV